MKLRPIFILCWRNLVELVHQKTLLAFIIIFAITFPVVFGAVFGKKEPVIIDIGIIEKEQVGNGFMSKEQAEELVTNFTNVFKKCKITNVKYREKLRIGENITEEEIKDIFYIKEIEALTVIPENFSNCIMFSVDLPIYIAPTLGPDRKSLVENTMISIVKTFSERIQDIKINYSKDYLEKSKNNSIPVGNLNVSIVDVMEGLARPIKTKLEVVESERSTPTVFDWIIAGIVGMTLMWFTIMPTAEKVAFDRVKGIRKRILISPCPRFSLLLGNTLFTIIVAACQISIVYAIAIFLFGHKVQGSLILISLIILITTIYCIGIGLIVGRFSKTPETASQIGMVVCFPMMFLSNVFFQVPKEGVVYIISKLLPLTYSCDMIRNVSIWGYGLSEVAGDLVIITVFAIIIYIIGTILTYKEED
ncbi:MAG: ABC transporter permease [Candidatus Thermoplasmatota archaeon]